MRIVFMGTPDFAMPMLERLLDSAHEIVAVVTQPDRPAGRGRKLSPPPIKERALQAGLTVLQPEKLRAEKFHETLAALKPDAAVVVAYGKILPREVLDTPRHGCFNIHASLLPKYRGAAPIQRAIADCGQQTGVTIMKLDEGMDTGPIVCAQEVDILEDDDTISLGNMLSVVGADLMMQTLERLERDGSVPLTPQDEAQATHAPMIEREDGRIDWRAGNRAVSCLIRAMIPWPSAWTTHNGQDWKILAAEPFTTPEGDPIPAPDGSEPGEVIALVKGRGIAVATGDGSVLLTRVKLPDRAAVEAAALINAHLLKTGDILGAQV